MSAESTTKTESIAPPQSVRIETTLWWEDECPNASFLFLGNKLGGVLATAFSAPLSDEWIWWLKVPYTIKRVTHQAPTREAAKAAALQAVMEAIGAREVVTVAEMDKQQ